MLNVFRRNPRASTIEALYGAIVAQARAPVFYQDYRVSDTVNGRLDLLMLHLALTFERLSQGGEAEAAIGQALFDRFCRDMDDHLREQGVSDLKVPKEMRGLGAAFFGRHGTYLTALRAGDRAALQDGLRRNVYQDAPDGDVARLSAYVGAVHGALAGQAPEALVQAGPSWPDPSAVKPGQPQPAETGKCD
jgi:cytochrome b pre-mRNA-processing protein 3